MHNFYHDNATISASLKASLLEGFVEDKVIIEDQQKLLEHSPDLVPRTIAADEAFVHFRNKWALRLRAEDEAKPMLATDNRRSIL